MVEDWIRRRARSVEEYRAFNRDAVEVGSSVMRSSTQPTRRAREAARNEPPP
jgi:hypothetical protein